MFSPFDLSLQVVDGRHREVDLLPQQFHAVLRPRHMVPYPCR